MLMRYSGNDKNMKLPIPAKAARAVSEVVTMSENASTLGNSDTAAKYIPQNQLFGHVCTLFLGIIIGRFIVPRGYCIGMQKGRTN